MNPFDTADLIYPVKPVPPAPRRQFGVKVIGARGPSQEVGEPDQVYPRPAGISIPRDVPSATWTIPHALGRIPAVTVYGPDGEWMLPECYATETQVVIVHCAPTTGTVVLT